MSEIWIRSKKDTYVCTIYLFKTTMVKLWSEEEKDLHAYTWLYCEHSSMHPSIHASKSKTTTTYIIPQQEDDEENEHKREHRKKIIILFCVFSSFFLLLLNKRYDRRHDKQKWLTLIFFFFSLNWRITCSGKVSSNQSFKQYN
jgi:hypothetical protein